MVATRRRTTRGKAEKYEIGDKVELLRVSGIDVGILLSKDEEEDDRPGGVSHWVVSVDGSSEEEIISEKGLGRVLEAHDQSDESTFEKVVKDQPVKKPSKAKTKSTKKGNRRMNTRAGGRSGDDAVLNDGLDFERRPAPRPKKKDGDETVVEVKMLTGTLFIYRGEHRRVEFVRTV